MEHFFQKYCEENHKFLDAEGQPELRFVPEAMQLLIDHNWPGNVRELENAVERAVVLASETIVPVDVLAGSDSASRRPKGPSGREWRPAPLTLPYLKSWRISSGARSSKHWKPSNWSQTEAAERLRIPLSTLNQKIKRLEILVRKKERPYKS